MIPIDVLIRRVSSDDIFEGLLTVLEKMKIPARSWREGGVARSILGALSEFGAMGAAIVRDNVAGGFLDFATGDYLTAHVEDVYGVKRIEATFATGPVTLTNTRSVSHNIGADELVIRSSNTGARYRVTEAFVLGPGSESSPTSITVQVQAIEPGSASSVAPGELDELETPLTGVTVTNPTSIIGRDAETDEQLRSRTRAKKGTWSPFGPRDAYEYAALSATLPDGTPTSITRVRVSRYSSVGEVRTVVATPNGTPSNDEIAAVREAIERWARPDSVTSIVEGAVQVPTSHSVIVWAQGGTESVIRSRAQAALADFYATYPIGGIAKTDNGHGYLYLDAIAATLIKSSPEVFDVDFIGGADIPLAHNEVAVNTTTLEVRIR